MTSASAVLSVVICNVQSTSAVKNTGGCVLFKNKTLSVIVTNGVDELECSRFDSYPADQLIAVVWMEEVIHILSASQIR